MGIFQKVGKATQIEKCSTRSQPIKQVFLQYKITKCTISQEIFTRFARYLYSTKCNWIIMRNYLMGLEHNIISYQCRGLSYPPKPKPKAEADNIDARFDNLQYHAKTKFNNWFIIHLWKQFAKEESSLWFCKSLRTLHGRGAWKLGII